MQRSHRPATRGTAFHCWSAHAELQFELDLLPDALRSWVADVADRVQCPPDAAATAILALGS